MEVRWIRQPLDHFAKSGNPAGALRDDDATDDAWFMQRYVVSEWTGASPPRTVFFYAGNEAPVTKYVDSCGMMWENRAAFRATLVFAEHRFWGASVPARPDYARMGPEQAIEDYARLLEVVNPNRTMRVVAFGGSYGGMLAAWMRLTRPDVVDAAVASSAPVLAFPHPDHEGTGQRGLFYGDFGASYWRVVTRGHMAPCARGVNAVLSAPSGLVDVALRELGVCPSKPNGGEGAPSAPLTDDDVAMWVAFAFDNLAMGDYTFRTDYISPGLPKSPAAAACAAFAAARLARGGDPVAGLRAALDVWYNASRAEACYRVPPRWDVAFYDGLWDRMFCLNLMPQET